MQQNYLYLLIGALLTGIVGWVIRIQEAKKSVHLKDLRSHIDAIYEYIEEIEDLSATYFLSIAKTEEIETAGLKIKAKLRNVGSRVTTIHKSGNIRFKGRDHGILTKLYEFRRAITLENFDNADRIVLVAIDPKFGKISATAEKLKSALELVYDSQK